MNVWGVLTLAGAYALPALLALGILARSSRSLSLRTSALAVTVALYAITLMSLPQLLGWPAKESPPDRFRFVAADIQQPDKATRDPGAIYLWVTDAAELSTSPPPRAYRLPYSGPLHEVVGSAMAKLQSGSPQLGEFRHVGSSGFGGIESSEPSVPAEVPIRFYDMSDPLFPDK
ncbi:MAG: hypothetical protein HYY48_00635 [Gammaproteobacteria bacterium]|nr:hypothetical protein [Gammaproteobacteria bacterium]